MNVKEKFIEDLEKLLNEEMSDGAFYERYVGSRAIDIEKESEGAIPDVTDAIGHYLSDRDLRASDPKYFEMQKYELRKMIKLIRQGATADEIRGIGFLEKSFDGTKNEIVMRDKRRNAALRIFTKMVFVAIAVCVLVVLYKIQFICK